MTISNLTYRSHFHSDSELPDVQCSSHLVHSVALYSLVVSDPAGQATHCTPFVE